jgi:aspartate aminotransferase
MPDCSSRADRLPSSPIRKLVDYAVRAEREGVCVHYLNIGQPDIHSPAEFWAALKSSDRKLVEYSHSAGIAELRSAMADDYGKRGISVDPEHILVTNGGSEATLFAFLTCFDPGDELIVVEPFYANYAGFAVAAGIHLVPITTHLDEDFALPATESIAAKLTPRTKGILLCNPSNPTGTVYPPDHLREIARLAKSRDLFLIVDEVYRDFYYGSEELLSVMQIPELEGHAVMIDSASKKFSLCGSRVGFLGSRNPAVIAGALKLGQARLAAPTLEQIGVAKCLRETPPSYFDAVRTEYMARRDTLVQELGRIPGVKCPRIDGAFYAVVRLPVQDTDEFCEWLVREHRHENQTVLLAPASGFYITPGLGKSEVRIAYVLDRDRLRAAASILSGAISHVHEGD